MKAGSKFIDDYHFPMVADELRNNLYYAALQKAIVPNYSHVLDVGAGTMLLSMMSMQLGAAKVLGVEANPLMVSIAKEVLQVNNFSSNSYSNKIHIFEGEFEKLKLGYKHLKQPADIMVSETFDAALIGEKFLSILKHAKSSGILSSDATIIPNSAIIHAQLLQSTLSLPITNSSSHNGYSAFFASEGRFNLEPLRRFRPVNVYTVRYLNEANAVRQRLSPIYPMFNYDFQDYDLPKADFDYSCLIFDITAANEGVFDSIGLWFSLFLDKEKQLILTNSPETPSCWMQSMYRVSQDVAVKRGDFLRIQVVQLLDVYVFADVGLGRYNQDSRLIKFTAEHCPYGVDVFAIFANDDDDDDDDETEVDVDGKGSNLKQKEVYVGKIPPTEKANNDQSFNVFPARVHQLFKLVTRSPSKDTKSKSFGLYYELPDSTEKLSGSVRAKARRKIPLDTYTITCPA